ncbi:MAG: sigma 54-interacting transcriptional regulator, partial [Calditrichaceae bacterium]
MEKAISIINHNNLQDKIHKVMGNSGQMEKNNHNQNSVDNAASIINSDTINKIIINSDQKIDYNKIISSKTKISHAYNDESIYRFGNLIGGSQVMQKVYRQIMQVAPTNIPILLLGETGTGKELAAQAIHKLSPKHDG